MMPKRIQLKRTKGWRMPEAAKSVVRPSYLGNPFVIDRDGSPAEVVEKYRAWLAQDEPHLGWYPDLSRRLLTALCGHDLACWCKLCAAHKDGKPFGVHCPDCAPCHADVLGEIANEKEKQ